MFNVFHGESCLKVIYNRNTKMFTCISSDWCNGKTDKIVFETDSNCDGCSKAVMDETEACCFNKLISEIKEILDDERIWEKPRYEGNYLSADYDCGVNRRDGIRIHDFDTCGKGHYVKCTFENRWGRWEYGD